MSFRGLLCFVILTLSIANIPFSAASGAQIAFNGNAITSIVGFYNADPNIGVEFYDGVEQVTFNTLSDQEVSTTLTNTFVTYMTGGINADLDLLPSNVDTFLGIEYNANNNPQFIIDQKDTAYLTGWSEVFNQGNSINDRANSFFNPYSNNNALFDTSIEFEFNSPFRPYGRVRFVDISIVPVPAPAAVWLFGSALGAIGFLVRRVTHV